MKKLITGSGTLRPAMLFVVLVAISCQETETDPGLDPNAAFVSFSTNGQTLPAAISRPERSVKVEVDHGVDVSRLTPEFDIPKGYTVYANGVAQVSGKSVVDFSQEVTYELKDANNRSTSWKASVVPLSCKILIDASHDGGVWWYPQWEGTGFDPNQWHQGQTLANTLREKGFEVNELGRGKELTEEMFFGHYIVIRVNGFESYTPSELQVYTKLLDRGMNMVFFTDHKKNDRADELADHVGLNFQGVASGAVTKLVAHEITSDLISLDYIAGSVLTNAANNPNIEVLGWLGNECYGDLNFNDAKDANEPSAPPVMGILNYPNSRIFFIGDMNGLEIQPQPFIDNLIQWMGTCF